MASIVKRVVGQVLALAGSGEPGETGGGESNANTIWAGKLAAAPRRGPLFFHGPRLPETESKEVG